MLTLVGASAFFATRAVLAAEQDAAPGMSSTPSPDEYGIVYAEDVPSFREAGLDDDDLVIGVVAGGRPRA